MTWLDASFQHRVNDFNLSISMSMGKEIAVLFGPSGAGKSMTIRTLAGLIRPSVRGNIKMGDRVISSDKIWTPPRKRKIGLVFQDLALFPHMTAKQNIEFALQSTVKNDKKQHIALQWLDRVGLTEKADSMPSQLSGGQRQRVALARAMAGEPELLLLDEPFSALDSPLRRSLRRELKKLHRETGTPLIYVTHQIEDVCAMGDRIFLIKNGSVSGDISSTDLSAGNSEKWHSLGWGNMIEGTVVRGTGGYWFFWEGGKLLLPPSTEQEGKASAFIPPDRMVIVYPDIPLDGIFSGNAIRSTILEKYTMGSTRYIYAKTGNVPLQVQFPVSSYDSLDLYEGMEVSLAVRPCHISLIFNERS